MTSSICFYIQYNHYTILLFIYHILMVVETKRTQLQPRPCYEASVYLGLWGIKALVVFGRNLHIKDIFKSETMLLQISISG